MKVSTVVINGQQCKRLSGTDYWITEDCHLVTIREVKPDKYGSVRLVRRGQQVRRKLIDLFKLSFRD